LLPVTRNGAEKDDPHRLARHAKGPLFVSKRGPDFYASGAANLPGSTGLSALAPVWALEDQAQHKTDHTDQECTQHGRHKAIHPEPYIELSGDPGRKPEHEAVDGQGKEAQGKNIDEARRVFDQGPDQGIDQSKDCGHYCHCQPGTITSDINTGYLPGYYSQRYSVDKPTNNQVVQTKSTFQKALFDIDLDSLAALSILHFDNLALGTTFDLRDNIGKVQAL
jgi:hypothetical protein